MNPTAHQYRSGEARMDMFAGVGILIHALIFAGLKPDMWEGAAVFAVLAGGLIWRALRGWRVPYVELSQERLVVFERGRAKHYVELAAVASVRQGFNRTILLMRDGIKISISHLGFMSSDDARHFRQTLAARFESPAIQQS